MSKTKKVIFNLEARHLPYSRMGDIILRYFGIDLRCMEGKRKYVIINLFEQRYRENIKRVYITKAATKAVRRTGKNNL